MKKSIVIIVIVIHMLALLACATAISEDYEPSITRVSIGMTWDDVRSIERYSQFSEDDTTLHYIDKVYNIPADIIYTFENNSLKMVFIRFVEAPVVPNGYITSFNSVDVQMKTDFNAPTIDKEFEFADALSLEKVADNYGLLVFIGELTIKSIWNINGTQIGHIMLGDSEKITHGILMRAW